jgi:glycosyltransferase involved in cell wall biosynthesis
MVTAAPPPAEEAVGVPASSGSPARPRAVILVANVAAPYSRGLRVARSLAEQGYEVEIAATTGDGQPVAEADGQVAIRRYRPSGPWARFATGALAGTGRGVGAPLARLARLLDTALKVVAWPIHVRGWWRTLSHELPPADLYHACGILTVPVALGLARAARAKGRRGRVVYDVIDVILESNNYDRVPAPILAWCRFRERRWVRASDAVVTVNEPIADHLTRSWRLPTRPTVLLNCQPRWTPPAERPDHIRAATGLGPETRIVLFLGRLGRERGLEEAAEAVLRVDDAALVMLGFGAWADRLRERDREPRFAGRHFTLPPVHPDDVPAWTSSADVSIIAVPANSLNQRLSTPNKFWESLTAGTPVVVGRDLEVMRRIVEADGLGAAADPTDPDDLARALRVILDQPAADQASYRARCLRVTHERYNWEVAVTDYLELVRQLLGDRPPA